MPVTRMRMRPWLERMIDSNSISGLTWVDKNRTMFSIPWKHAARHGWEMDKDANLFKQWAIHTGKYSEGQACDPKTWKANFRCAMNSLPDIEEVKDKSVNKGHQAVRVFRMLPATPKAKAKRCKATDKQRKRSSAIKTEDEDEESYSDTQSSVESMHEDSSSTQENIVDSTVNAEQTDNPFELLPSSEVPEWSSSIEIGFDSFPDTFRHKFEVSPEHFPDDDCTDDIIKICQQLEKDAVFFPSSTDAMGFLINEVCSSPESNWSDSSDPDEPQYTTLSSDLTFNDNFWNSFRQPVSFPML